MGNYTIGVYLMLILDKKLCDNDYLTWVDNNY